MCEHKRREWKDYLSIYESLKFLQCIDCGAILSYKNYVKGASR